MRIVPVDQFGRIAYQCHVESLSRAGQPEAPKLPPPAGLEFELAGGKYWVEVTCREGKGEHLVDVESGVGAFFSVAPLYFDHLPTLSVQLTRSVRDGAAYVQLTGVSRPGDAASARFDTDGVAHLPGQRSGVYTMMIVADAGQTCLLNLELAEGTKRWRFDLESCVLMPDHYAFVVQSNSADPDRDRWEAAMVAEQAIIRESLRAAAQTERLIK